MWGKKNMLYGIVETDIGDHGILTFGGMHQKSKEIPDFAGVMLPCENPKAYSVFENNCNNPVRLPRNTYLGMDWSRLRADKTNLFPALNTISTMVGGSMPKRPIQKTVRMPKSDSSSCATNTLPA